MTNIAEEYVATYLRLNGFFLLQNFTHLVKKEPGSGHVKESDILAVRLPNTSEKVEGNKLPVDEELFSEGLLKTGDYVLVIVEVKGNMKIPEFEDEKTKYLLNFFGDQEDNVILIAVSGEYSGIEKDDSENRLRVNIGINYLMETTRELVVDRVEICKKAESWNLAGDGLLQKLIYEERVKDFKH